MSTLIRVIFAFSLSCILCQPAAGRTIIPQFWESEFHAGLDQRDSYLRMMGLDPQSPDYGLTRKSQWESFGERLYSLKDINSPWFHFLSGLVLIRSDTLGNGQYATVYFSRALELADKDPGTAWALFAEFRRFDIKQYLDRSISLVEKQFLASGAQSSSLIVQQLLFWSTEEERAQRTDMAIKYLDWASLFDKYPVWENLRKAKITLFLSPEKTLESIRAVLSDLGDSWRLQLSAVSNAFDWFCASLQFLVIAVFLVNIVVHIGSALHPFSDLFPQTISPRMRLTYCIAMYCSLLFFGFLPFFWITAFILWPRMEARSRVMTGICMTLLILAPLQPVVQDLLRAPLKPNTTLFLYEKTLDEGYSPDLEVLVKDHVSAHADDYLANVSAAMISLKKGDSEGARSFIQKAIALRENDPVVLLTAGNVNFYTRNLERANEYFNKCLALFPNLETSYFDPSAYFYNSRNITDGINLIEKATRLDSKKISGFLKKNDDFFAGNWPLMRQFIQSEYTPGYFWKEVFPRYRGGFATADARWGDSFLGLDMTSYLIASIAFLVLVLMSSRILVRRQEFFCKYCGIRICGSCKRGSLCQDCNSIVGDISDQSIQHRMGAKISIAHQQRAIVIPLIMDALFAGTGSFYVRTKVPFASIPLVMVTAMIYGLFLVSSRLESIYPQWATRDLISILLHILIVYIVIFFVRSVVIAGSRLRKVSA